MCLAQWIVLPPEKRMVEGSTPGGSKMYNCCVFLFPIFFKYILQKHTFSFFHPECRLFQNRNGILEANYRRKASDVTEHDWLPFHLGGGYGYT